MDIFQILVRLLEKPDVPKFYRQLREAYQSQNKLHEAEAIGYLIEKKFGKINEAVYPTGGQEQRQDVGSDT